MKKVFTRLSLVVGAVPLLAFAPVGATASSYFTDFNQQQSDLYYEIYEGGSHNYGSTCGTDACLTYETQGRRTYGKFTVNPSANPGYFQNVAASQTAPGADDQGPYTATYGHPVTLEAKIKWSANYNADGTGDAQGTSGIVLWNGEGVDGTSLPDSAQLGFTWTSQDVLGGFLSGFMASSIEDLQPVGLSAPAAPIDINDWIKVKVIWSEDAQGVQSVAYYADSQLLGTHVLPQPLHGLGLEIWNDNQEPVFCDTGLCFDFPNPDQAQSLYVDYVKIEQS